MEVVIYRAKGQEGYLYDISLNPGVDYEILKRTRKIEKMTVISPGISIEKGDKILKSIYGKSSIFGRFISSEDAFLNNILKKHGIKRVDTRISENSNLPSLEDIGRVEEFIVGKVVSLQRIFDMKEDIGLNSHSLLDIVQALYCERRIRMVPAVKRAKGKDICFLCEREACPEDCGYGFDRGDILLYAADNYNISMPPYIDVKKRKVSEVIRDSQNGFSSFIRSKKETGILWVAPHSFEYDILVNGIYEIIRRGGSVLYITSSSLMFEARETMKKLLEGARVEITNGLTPIFRELDISICSYSDYPCFYKAFDLVVLDERNSLIEGVQDRMYFIARRAVKEKGKFLDITCVPDREKRGMFRSTPEIIPVPVSSLRNPIPEPRIITSRFLEGPEPFLPPMAMDVIKWSLYEEMRMIIFVPDESVLHGVYYYLTTMEGIEKDLIDTSSERNKSALLAFKKGECKILISYDFKDALHIMEDVNVTVMRSENECYSVDVLVNMAAMATMHGKNSLAEVAFVAQAESDSMSLAKSTIRGVNKIAWEKGYIKH